ncbi:hypothetical protein [Spiroplasma endosymbiont of Colias croceus]|uniref:hypothetical protein n=1 Tax=Spiroplasma endosymbiont of Colias croceus TaxID=3066310 RepID=UPI0030CC6FF4
MENKNNIDWNVNLNYITKDDLKTIYGFIPDADQTTTDNTKTDFTIMAIAISSERINTITGNQIEVIGFKNLNETQQQLVKRATARMTIYYLTDGMAFIRSSVSISGNGLSSSISPPSEPDYVLMEVYNLLQQANLHTPRKAINNSISCNTDNFNTPSIFDESDTRVITWDSANKTFLQKQGIIAGIGIKIDDVSDTIPKLKIHVDSNIDSLWEVNKDNPNFIKPKDFKGIDVNGKRIIDVGTPTFLSDATTKQYVDDLLDKKQNKLIAGTNITIDENNKISAIGGTSDLSDYYKKEEVNKKLEDKMDKNQFKYAFSINTIGTEIPNLETTNKTVAGAINENKSNIDKKQDKENWKIIGESINNREYSNFKLWFDKLYRVLITWEKPPFNQVNTRIIVEFKTGKYLGGNAGDKIFLTQGEIDGIEANLYLVVVNANNFKLIIEGANEKYGNIFSLEELQNTIKVNILPLNIISKTLNIKLLEKDAFNIELKDIPPKPSPSGSNWKEVGEVITDKNNNNQNFIKYIFKDKTHYRIYISYGDYTSKENNKNYSWQIINFYYQLDTSVVKSSLWIANNNNNQQTEINIYNNRIMWGMGRDYIFKKLEELQE